MPTVAAGVGAVSVTERGAREPVVLLHANLHDHHDYDPIIEPLAARFRVPAMDRPGHGESDPLPLDTSASAALRVTSRNIFTRTICRTLGNPTWARMLLPHLIPRYMRAQSVNDTAVMNRAPARSRAGIEIGAGLWRSFADPAHDLRVRAARIAAPTLLVWGTEDPVLPLREARRAQSIIPGARLVTLPTGHVVFSYSKTLVDAGLRLAERVGLTQMSVNLVVAEAQVSKGVRAGYLRALHQNFHDRLPAPDDHDAGGVPMPGRERLWRGTIVYLDACRKQPSVRALLLEARAEPVVAAEIRSRNNFMARLAEPDFRAIGPLHTLDSARLWSDW